ncbi:copper resistance D family protein [Amycolatopsis regifaucium]|uniref:Copper resistance protein CopD n=1 Tax=Amycolatopsis regifaucium TaxID=546365 RepID=A0A154MQ92_9PSEU|nr:CopD family protein [Amycolatopsis regifaucium]KZB86425.1 copper resistance protein CopD [Amycolatopsis regifaucium]OKA06384.1 copper resistance protein CopD [Amycolatopsis regifaucium]SFJ29504.1 putative copper resistance protein D [Amycolatopsis regifaucium]
MTQAETTSRARVAVLFCVATAAMVGVLIGVALTATAPVPGVAQVSEVVSVSIPIVRVLLDISAVVTIGLALLSVLVGYDRPKLSEPIMRIARPASVAAALVWATTALVALILQTAEYRPGSSTLSMSDVGSYIADVGAGKALLIVAVLALLHAGLGILALKHGEKVPAEVRVGLGLFALLPLPVTGHASNWNYHDYTMISMELHVMSAVAWTGGLGAMTVLLIGNRTLLAHALPRFSKLATLCLLLGAATGLFNGLIEITLNPSLGFWEGLFTTPYGQLVLLKLSCTGVIAGLGGYTRWKLMPRIIRHNRTALAAWATLELTVMGLAFGFAVVLTRAPVVPTS